MLGSRAAAEAVAAAEVLVRQEPLREERWRLLALGLWASGRQAEALAGLRRARRHLATELGLDLGPVLVELEGAILGQRMEVLAEAVGQVPDPASVAAGPDPRAGAPAAGTAPPGEVFVGRQAELAALAATAGAVRGGGSRVVLVTGEAGVGKSSLLARMGSALESDGWLVVAGRCPEAEGAPPAWAWVEALRSLAGRVPPGELAGPLAPLLEEDRPSEAATDAAAGRFRLRRAVCAWLRVAAGSRPLAIVLDDLHNADAETLALLAGLSPPEVRELVRAVHQQPLDAATMAALAERTGGNPFYVWESVRLLASEGALVATSEVPEGVRDVLRRRLARRPPAAVSVLRLAAVVGRDADVEVLVRAAGTGEAAVLDALEAGLIAGLLTEPAPGKVRFAHVLARDTLYTDLPQLRRGRLHARVAAAVEELHPEDLPALAHHHLRAASPGTAAKAVGYAVRAAEAAERRYAHDTAAELLTRALDSQRQVPAGHDPPGGDPAAERADLFGRLLRAQVRWRPRGPPASGRSTWPSRPAARTCSSAPSPPGPSRRRGSRGRTAWSTSGRWECSCGCWAAPTWTRRSAAGCWAPSPSSWPARATPAPPRPPGRRSRWPATWPTRRCWRWRWPQRPGRRAGTASPTGAPAWPPRSAGSASSTTWSPIAGAPSTSPRPRPRRATTRGRCGTTSSGA
jgi:hypothetical protein